ncbi:hypothetical protein CRUP_024189, partial [Coryphaenoides rupestris]
VELELRSQVVLFVELLGYRPGHMDGHQHVHVLPVEQEALEAAEAYLGLSTMGQNMSVSNVRRALLLAMETAPGSSSSSRVLTAELMVHPGYPSLPARGGCGEGPDEFSCSADRLQELQTLSDPSLLELYAQEKVQLCAFKDL